MATALELHDSRINRVDVRDGVVTVEFSLGYIHKSRGRPGREPGSVWSQELEIVFHEARVEGDPALPNTIYEGFLEVGRIRHELVPLPFRRRGAAVLSLEFADGARLTVTGERPVIELRGAPLYLEDYP